MIIRLIILGFILFGPVLVAQETEPVEEEVEITLPGTDDEKIEMEVNSFFSENFNNVHYTADFRARIVAAVQPISYSDMKANFDGGIPTSDNTEVIEKGEITKEGVILLYFTYTITGGEEDMGGVSYYKSKNEKEVYTIVGSYPLAHKAIYAPIILKAAITAK